jgi:hypothetical protein
MAQENVGINIQVGGNQDQALGSLKAQLREATNEVTKLSEQFGASSREAVEAAKRAAELKDQIGDAKSLIDAFNPDAKFKALTASLSGVAGGFSALQGATALFGKENEDLEKTLLKVQSAMALSQGLQAVGESVDSFKQLGTVIKSTTVFQSAYNFVMGKKVAIQEADVITTIQATAATEAHAAATNSSTTATAGSTVAMKAFRGALLATGIGAIVIGITLLIQNFDKVKKVVTNLFPGLAQLGSFFGNIITKVTDFIGVTSQAERALSSLEKTTKRGNEGIEARIKVLTAQGGKEKEIYALSKQQGEAELNFLRAKLNTKKGLNDEELKKFRDLKTEQAVLDIQEQKRQQEALKENAKAGAEASKAAAEQRKKNNEDRIAAEKEAQKQLADLRNQLFLSTFKDENEKKKAELNLAFIKEKDEILANTKINEATRNELILAARLKLNADLDALAAAQKEKKAAEDAKLLEESAKQIETENDKEYNQLQAEIAKKNKLNEDARKAELDADISLQNAKFEAASAGLNLLSSLAGQNEKIANAIFVIDKALAIAKIVVDTQREIAGYYAANAAFGLAGAAIATKQALVAKIRAGIGIASIAGTTIAKFKGGGAAGGAVGGSSGGAAPSVSAAAPLQPPQPQATTLSSQTINAIGNQAIRSYVVESDVTSNQQRIAAIQQRARFG